MREPKYIGLSLNERYVEDMQHEIAALRSAICINMREELSLDGVMTEDDYHCDSQMMLLLRRFYI